MTQIKLFLGGIRPLPESGRPTGMYKQPVDGRIEIGPEGIVGDHQADRRVHGGPDKALHLYPAAHYARLAERFPEAASQLLPGSLGENISTDELDEHAVRIGDIWRLGTARLQVCQPRSPCWKIDERMAADGMAEFIAHERLTGWYWRVLTPGTACAGDGLSLDTPGTINLGEAQLLCQMHRPPVADLQALAETPGIAENWRGKLLQRLSWLRQHPSETPPQQPGFHVKPENA